MSDMPEPLESLLRNTMEEHERSQMQMRDHQARLRDFLLGLDADQLGALKLLLRQITRHENSNEAAEFFDGMVTMLGFVKAENEVIEDATIAKLLGQDW